MSSTLKARYRLVKFLHDNIGGVRRFNWRKLKKQNLEKVLCAQKLWVASLSDTLGLVDNAEKPFRSLCSALNALDVYDWLTVLDSFDEDLLSSVSERSSVRILLGKPTEKSRTGNKAMFIHCLNTLLIPKWRSWNHKRDPDSFRALHQCFAFPHKLSLELEELERIALKSWKANDERFGAEYPAISRLSPLKRIVTEWFPKSDEESLRPFFVPRHGAGAVVEGCKTLAEKYAALTFSYEQFALLDATGVLDGLTGTALQRPYLTMIPCEGNDICHTLFVKKSWKTYRTISKEPVTTMWLQQGLGSMIERAVLTKAHCGVKAYYCFNTEDTNRYLTEIGSLDGSYATIDLSAASDRIRWSLIDYLFKDTWIFPYMEALRTPYTRVSADNNSVYTQGKYAPMGNRQCFPIMSIVLSACLEWISRYHSGVDTAGLRFSDAWPIGCIYGDDIVIRTPYVQELFLLLDRLGLKVNREKSFYSSDPGYRESCGAEFLFGVDVTPFRLGREFVPPGDVLRTLESCTATANSLFNHGLMTARLLIVDHFLSRKIPIFFDDGTCGFRSENPLNHHLKSSWHEHYQHWYARAVSLEAPALRPAYDMWDSSGGSYLESHEPEAWVQRARLYEWLRTANNYREEAHVMYFSGNQQRKVCVRYVPVEGLPPERSAPADGGGTVHAI